MKHCVTKRLMAGALSVSLGLGGVPLQAFA